MSDELQSDAAAGTPSVGAAAPPPPAKKSFDVALVDPHNPAVEHWPRVRVTIEAATLDDLTAEQKAPPRDAKGKLIGESAEAEAKRLAFLVSEIERRRAIDAYNAVFKLDHSHLRYDVAEAKGEPPAALSEEWSDHLAHIHGK